MQQILFRIPGLNIPIFGFGAMLCLAFLLCTWLAARRARRVGIAPEHVQDVAIWILLGGVLGARISHLLLEPPLPANIWDFLRQLPRIWDGGLILYGSVAGGLLGYIAFYWMSFRRHGIPTLQLADVLAPSIALGIGLGRLGCFLNGCCYGQVACAACAAYPVTYPLSAPPRYALVRAGYQTAAGFTYADSDEQPRQGVRIGRVEPGSKADIAGLHAGDVVLRVNGEALDSNAGSPTEQLHILMVDGWKPGRNDLTLTVLDPFSGQSRELTIEPRTLGLHPAQVYETISMFLLFLVLLALDPLRRREGTLMAVLMMGYAVHRALNERLRDDARPEGWERYTSYFLFAAGLTLLVWVCVYGRKAMPIKSVAASAPS